MLTDINSLNKNEIKKFEDFINSPYFNKYETIKKLFYYLKKEYPNVKKEYVCKENLSFEIYGEKELNNVKIRKLESEFGIQFHKFLQLEESINNRFENDIFLLSSLRKKSLYKAYNKKTKEMKNSPDEYFGENETYYYNKINLYKELSIFTTTVYKIDNILNAINLIDYLNNYFLHLSFASNCFYCSLIDSIPGKYRQPLSMINEAHIFVEKNKSYFSKHNSQIFIMYYCSLLIQSNDEKYFKALQIYCNKNKEIISSDMFLLYYLNAESFLSNLVESNQTNRNCMKLFKFRSEMLDYKHYYLLHKNGQRINSTRLFYIFRDAVNLKKFDWAEMFIDKYVIFLPEEEKENILNLTKAILNFFRKEYLDIFLFLNRINKNKTRQFIHSRYIKLMMHFEAGDLSTLLYEAEAMKKYLDRKRSGNTYGHLTVKNAYIFINYIFFLVNLKNNKLNRNGTKYRKLKSEIFSDSMLPVFKFWFKDKFKELEKNQKQII